MAKKMATAQQELIVRGEQVERVFINFQDNKYVVNRRYQRKLIWTIEEKQSFIDSIIQGFPIPIILLAEPIGRQDGTLEIIDGMQRMNAITSFIGNDFSVDGCYFDLNTFATTKDLLDRKVIAQKTPVLDRERCLAILAVASSLGRNYGPQARQVRSRSAFERSPREYVATRQILICCC